MSRQSRPRDLGGGSGSNASRARPGGRAHIKLRTKARMSLLHTGRRMDSMLDQSITGFDPEQASVSEPRALGCTSELRARKVVIRNGSGQARRYALPSVASGHGRGIRCVAIVSVKMAPRPAPRASKRCLNQHRIGACRMAKYTLAVLAVLVVMQSSLPAMAAQGGGRARSCREQCDRQPCQASPAVCQQSRKSCLARCN
jgi:hypothetical protein